MNIYEKKGTYTSISRRFATFLDLLAKLYFKIFAVLQNIFRAFRGNFCLFVDRQVLDRQVLPLKSKNLILFGPTNPSDRERELIHIHTDKTKIFIEIN